MNIRKIDLEAGEGNEINIVELPEAEGQIQGYRDAVKSGLIRLFHPGAQAQVAEIYLGNPGDSGYVDAPVQAVYLGSYRTMFNNTPSLHIWLHRSHEGSIQASSTYGPKDNRSTCGFLGGHGWGKLGLDDQTIQTAERLLDKVAAKIAA